eukprot:13240050-Alexandrium_andersonii.AAC.1
MSASLVGSEMCIRDSACRASRLPCERALRGRALRCRAALLALGSARDPPVSYTHLTLPTICSV